VAGARIGRINGAFVLNPTLTELKDSDLNFIIAASREAVVMVEGEALFVPESVVAEALAWAQAEIQPLIEAQVELTRLMGKKKRPLKESPDLASLREFIAGAVLPDFKTALAVPEKMRRREAKKAIREKALAALTAGGSPYAASPEAVAPLAKSWAIWKKPLSGSASARRASASTAATSGRCGPSALKPAPCPEPTVPPSSPGGKPSPWSSPLWAAPWMSSAWIPWSEI
jgi:hypothetical protein